MCFRVLSPSLNAAWWTADCMYICSTVGCASRTRGIWCGNVTILCYLRLLPIYLRKEHRSCAVPTTTRRRPWRWRPCSSSASLWTCSLATSVPSPFRSNFNSRAEHRRLAPSRYLRAQDGQFQEYCCWRTPGNTSATGYSCLWDLERLEPEVNWTLRAFNFTITISTLITIDNYNLQLLCLANKVRT